MPATGDCDRHTGIHQRERRAADRSHRARTVRFENVADHAERVRELCLVRDDRRQSALGQCAVADFAPAGAAHEADFADAERREVVVQHEALRRLGDVEHLDPLRVFLRAERGGDQRLRFAAREQRRTVRPRQHADFDRDRSNLIERAAIRTAAFVQHLVAEDPFLQAVEVARRPASAASSSYASATLFFSSAMRVIAVDLLVLLGVHRVGEIRANLR